jgi:protein TonB
MIDAVPPHYPYESRRLKEQGTVLLDVQLSMSGTVERVSVRTSSGFARLDKAALEAVRRWRWSPTVRDGQPVAVRGVVEIPFTLMSRKNSR